MNDLGDCLLPETAFNISKSDKPLVEQLKDVHEFKNEALQQAQWASVPGLTSEMLDPLKATFQDAAIRVDYRTAAMKTEIKEFVSGEKRRVDV